MSHWNSLNSLHQIKGFVRQPPRRWFGRRSQCWQYTQQQQCHQHRLPAPARSRQESHTGSAENKGTPIFGNLWTPSCTSAAGADCERIPQTEYIIKSSFQGASGEELCYSVHLVSVQRAGPQQTILKARQHDRWAWMQERLGAKLWAHRSLHSMKVSAAHRHAELDDGWPESEKDVFQAALSMVVVKNSRWMVDQVYMSYGGIGCEK